MSAIEALPSIGYLTDDTGRRTAVLVDIRTWESLVSQLDGARRGERQTPPASPAGRSEAEDPASRRQAAWARERRFIEDLIAQGPVPGGRTWTREDLYDR